MRPIAVRRIVLAEKHRSTGKTKHYSFDSIAQFEQHQYKTRDESRLVPPPYALVIVQYGEREYNLIHLDEKEEELTDTFHESIDEAMAQANFEFGILPDEWLEVSELYN